MSAILYNTSSSLVPKFQRHDLLKQSKELSDSQGTSRSSSIPPGDRESYHLDSITHEEDIPFHSDAIKNSVQYLRELCCSIYPSCLHKSILKMNCTADLAIYSFSGLILKTFVCSWYGTKIPTSDDQFLNQIFNTIQDSLIGIKAWRIDYEHAIADDIPRLIACHISAMRQATADQDTFGRFCDITNYKRGYYPQTISNIIKSQLDNGSQLQASFLDSLIDELLLSKIIDRVIEPYYFLKAISRAFNDIILRHSSVKKESKRLYSPITSTINAFKKMLTTITQLMKKPVTTKVTNFPLPYRYIFTFIFNDILRLSHRRPYLYAMSKTTQFWISKSAILNSLLHRLFFNLIEDVFVNERAMGNLFLSLRQIIFPNDNNLGPGSTIPEGEAFEKLKAECKSTIWVVISLYNLDSWLSIKKADVHEMIDMICKDKRCTKLLLFRIADCLLAHTQLQNVQCNS